VLQGGIPEVAEPPRRFSPGAGEIVHDLADDRGQDHGLNGFAQIDQLGRCVIRENEIGQIRAAEIASNRRFAKEDQVQILHAVLWGDLRNVEQTLWDDVEPGLFANLTDKRVGDALAATDSSAWERVVRVSPGSPLGNHEQPAALEDHRSNLNSHLLLRSIARMGATT
jgi:hypothetical protein